MKWIMYLFILLFTSCFETQQCPKETVNIIQTIKIGDRFDSVSHLFSPNQYTFYIPSNSNEVDFILNFGTSPFDAGTNVDISFRLCWYRREGFEALAYQQISCRFVV